MRKISGFLKSLKDGLGRIGTPSGEARKAQETHTVTIDGTNITLPAGGMVDGVDISEHDHSSGKGASPIALAGVPNLPTSKITSGTFATARIPDLDASKTTTGTFDSARIPPTTIGTHSAALITYGTMGAAKISGERITYGSILGARLGTLPASKITYGTMGAAKISGARITYGTIAPFSNRIGSLTAAKITYGTFNVARIPKLLHPYAGDETVVEGTYTAYHLEKCFRFLRNSALGVLPDYYKFGAELKSSRGGTAFIGVKVAGVAGTIIQSAQGTTTYQVLVGSKNVGALSDGVYQVNAYCRVTRGSYANRLWDNYLIA